MGAKTTWHEVVINLGVPPGLAVGIRYLLAERLEPVVEWGQVEPLIVLVVLATSVMSYFLFRRKRRTRCAVWLAIFVVVTVVGLVLYNASTAIPYNSRDIRTHGIVLLPLYFVTTSTFAASFGILWAVIRPSTMKS